MSKVAYPNPFPWGQATEADKDYFLVLRVQDSEIIRIVEFEALNNENLEIRKMSEKLYKLYKQYPHPEYDIISCKAAGKECLSSIFGAEDNFEGVEIEKI